MEERFISANLKGKIALVTGGAKGIGEAISRALAFSGADIAVNYNTSHERAHAIVKEFEAAGCKAISIQADVSIAGEAERLIRETHCAMGGAIDILINNAGTQLKQSTIEEMPAELCDRVFAVNLTGALVCSKYVIPGMKQKRWGRIINISSISARSGGGPGGSHYAASKAAMSSLTKSLAKELGPYSITANAIAPGVILTAMHEKFSTEESLENLKKMTPLGRLGQTQDVVGAVIFLASDSAAYITGATIAVNGGLRMD